MRTIILLSILCTLLSAEPREALLIGNHNYSYINNLDNPMKNLKRLKSSLEDIGFNVKIKEDLDSEHLAEAIEQFKNRLAKNSNTTGFLYYTGHGCQLDYQGYLIPTNVDTKKKLKIKYNALNINEMLENLKEAGNKVNLLFLDACRDVPTGAKGGTKGLAQPTNNPKGSLVVYATEAGKVANDNDKFINALIENINKPNQQIESLGSNISRVVAKKTNYTQVPVVYAKLLPENMVLKGGYIPSTPTSKPISTSKWIKPTNSVCIANGGELYKGVCRANWKNAKKICSASGGKLPNIDDLKKVIVDCGGLFTTKDDDKNWDSLSDKNMVNKSYRACYKQKGFNNWFYWTRDEKDSSYAWRVVFYYGFDDLHSKSNGNYVLCVR